MGAMVVSPTYFGAVADIAALAEVAHAHGLPLLVDEAWGAHLRFSDASRRRRSSPARTSCCPPCTSCWAA